jgi:NAD(P)-dependent dehydrogenase (short-subunit alcohol dehydrogenase family)
MCFSRRKRIGQHRGAFGEQLYEKALCCGRRRTHGFCVYGMQDRRIRFDRNVLAGFFIADDEVTRAKNRGGLPRSIRRADVEILFDTTCVPAYNNQNILTAARVRLGRCVKRRMIMKFKGKTAFITGGASGIGLAIAKIAAKEGMNVVLADLRRDALDAALPWFRENGAQALGLELNVTDRAAFEKAADDAETRFGNIHLLCNNAGIGCARGPLWEVSDKDTDLALDINLKSVLNGIRAVVPRMLRHGEGGHIVNTSSKNGLLPPPSLGLYNLTKGAVVSLTETLASDLPEGYGASVFCPGPFKTNLGQSSFEVPALINGEKPAAPPPPPAMPKDPEPGFYLEELTNRELPAEEAGRLVFRGIQRGDLYIITHPEYYEGVKARYDAVLRAFPKTAPNEAFKRMFSFMTYNPVFAKQREYI